MKYALLLFLQIVASVGIFVALKLANSDKTNKYQVLVINYIVAVATSWISVYFEGGFVLDGGRSLFAIWPSLIIGFLFVLNFILMMASTKRAGVGLTSAFSKMSVVIPVLVGIVFLGQNNNLYLKILGLIFTLISFYLILYKKERNDNKGGKAIGAVLLPILVFLCSGISDESQELSRAFLLNTVSDTQIFIFFIFLSSLFFCIVLSVADIKKNGFSFSWKSVLIGLLLGLSNYFTARLLMANVNVFGGSIVFPVVNASTVAFTSLIGVFFFKEKLSPRQWIGIAVAVAAVAVIAVSI